MNEREVRPFTMVMFNLTFNTKKQSNGMFNGVLNVTWMRERLNAFNTVEPCRICRVSRLNWTKYGACSTRADKERECAEDGERKRILWEGGTSGAT